jgi:hypothetical protein
MPFLLRSTGLAVLTLLAAAPALAQESASADSGRFVVYQGDMPIMNERFIFQFLGDSLALTAISERKLQDAKGAVHPYRKTMLLVADVRTLDLERYLSIEEFQGHTITRGLVPGDTSITYYRERDGAGDASRLVQPPGRLYVMESPMFCLFEVLCREFADKTFTTRRAQLVAISDTMTTPLATITRLAPDTLRNAGQQVIARHYRFEDPGATFDLWADPRGRLIKLQHAASGLRVERLPDPAPPPKPKAKKTAKK